MLSCVHAFLNAYIHPRYMHMRIRIPLFISVPPPVYIYACIVHTSHLRVECLSTREREEDGAETVASGSSDITYDFDR